MAKASHGINKMPELSDDLTFPGSIRRNVGVPKAIEDRPITHQQKAPGKSSQRYDEHLSGPSMRGNVTGHEDYL